MEEGYPDATGGDKYDDSGRLFPEEGKRSALTNG